MDFCFPNVRMWGKKNSDKLGYLNCPSFYSFTCTIFYGMIDVLHTNPTFEKKKLYFYVNSFISAIQNDINEKSIDYTSKSVEKNLCINSWSCIRKICSIFCWVCAKSDWFVWIDSIQFSYKYRSFFCLTTITLTFLLHKCLCMYEFTYKNIQI